MNVFHRRYVAIVAFSITVESSMVNNKLENLNTLIEGFGGKVEKVEALGVKKLAYPIKKQTSALYKEIVFLLQDNKALGENLIKINKALNHLLENTVLRSMVLKIEDRGLKNEALKSFSAFEVFTPYTMGKNKESQTMGKK